MLVLALLGQAAAATALDTGRLEGRARDEAGSPLPGVTVEVRALDGDAEREATTDSEGRFGLELPAGRYQVEFRLPSFATSVRTVEVPAGGAAGVEATLRVALTAHVLVTGRATFRSLTDLDQPVNGLIGLAESGSVGVVSASQTEDRPVFRSGEVFEAVPGVVI